MTLQEWEDKKQLVLNDPNKTETIEYLALEDVENNVFFYSAEKRITTVSEHGTHVRENVYTPTYNDDGVLGGYSNSEVIETVDGETPTE